MLATFAVSAAHAQSATTVKARSLVLVDTSGSMVWHFGDCNSAGGDGGNPSLYCDNSIGTNSAGKSGYTCAKACTEDNGAQELFPVSSVTNPSRLYAAKAALNNVINATSPSIDFGLERFIPPGANDISGVTVCSDANDCCQPATGTSTAGRCVPIAFNGYPDVPASTQCQLSNGFAGDCNTTFISGCGTSTVCTGSCTFEGGQILVQPGIVPNGAPANYNSSKQVLPWIDYTEDFCDDGTSAHRPRNPELRAGGATPLAGSIRTALDQWYEPIFTASNGGSCNPNTNPLCDTQINCRPYVNVVMTDGVETCEAGGAATSDPGSAVQALYNVNGTNPVLTYVIGLSINQVESCHGSAADKVTCPHTATSFTDGTTAGCLTYNGSDACACNMDSDCGLACEGGVFHYVCDTTNHVCVHPGVQILNDMAKKGGTNQAHFVNNQSDIEAVFANIVSQTVKVEYCNQKDDDCDTVCDEPYPLVAEPNTCNIPLNDPNSNGMGGRNAVTCNNGALKGTHCYAEGTYVCQPNNDGSPNAKSLAEVCSAPKCDAQHPLLCPVTESCNGVDDDCNGIIDDCVPNVAFSCCKMGCVPQPETCNGLDDDCDGIPDDHLVCPNNAPCNANGTCPNSTQTCDPRVNVVGGPPCVPLPAGHTMAPCNAGVTACMGGNVVCTNEVLPQPNTCDGVSRDCTGTTIAACTPGSTCFMGGCMEACSGSEFPCPGGYTCVTTPEAITACGANGCCLPDPCANQTCPSGDFCKADSSGNANCIDPCTLISCPTGYQCSQSQCVPVDTCTAGSCPAGQVCTGSPAVCQVDPCAGIDCPSGKYCVSGACIQACSACGAKQECVQGRCINDPCVGKCTGSGQVCVVVNGAPVCANNVCAVQGCSVGHACCGGECLVDPCAGLKCPTGTECALDSACNPWCGTPGKGNDRVVAGSGLLGCSYGGGGGETGGAWIFALALAVLLLRRRALTLVIVLVGAAALGLAGCNANPYCIDCTQSPDLKPKLAPPQDLAGADLTGHRDGGTTICVPTNGGVEICDHLDNDCNGMIDDVPASTVASDPNNCGTCFNQCTFASLNEVGSCTSGACTVSGCAPGWVNLTGDPTKGCQYQCTPSNGGVEICDGLDNDCNGMVDDGLTAPNTITCATQGVCACSTGGSPTCSIPVKCKGAAGWACDYSGVPNVSVDSSGNLTLTEPLCDHKDNNCNGVVDSDGFPTVGTPCTAGFGRCQGTGAVDCATPLPSTSVACSAVATPTNAIDEQCNGIDDDCDGQIDERVPVAGSQCYNGSQHPCVGWSDKMVPFTGPSGGTVYAYAYEASRPGATAASMGTQTTRACSQSNVLPWADVTLQQAQSACGAVLDSAGRPMRLCTAFEWTAACESPTKPTTPPAWSLSTTPMTYVANICNDANATAGAAWPTGNVTSTATTDTKFCYTPWPGGKIYDLSGNLEEWTSTPLVAGGTTYYKLRGGSFGSQSGGTTCEFDFDIADPGFLAPQIGFRCCSDNPPCGDTQSDPNNCGLCGHACLSTQVCSKGTCKASCDSGLTQCPGGSTPASCVDTTNNNANCGGCNMACTGGKVCSSSTCSCPSGLTDCGGICVDETRDPTHCGSCTNACGAGMVCSGSTCLAMCPGMTTACNGSCVDEQNDPKNCGGCNTPCPGSEGCAGGNCCPLTVCSGACVDTNSDNANCGGCAGMGGQACIGGATCSSGKCCGASTPTNCGGTCTNTTSDNSNCGVCGNSCGNGLTCQSGVCCGTTGGAAVCNGSCTNTNTDSNNCGACNTQCLGNTSCSSGHCCGTGQSYCASAGKCINTQSDPNNCGGCGKTCGSGVCTGGVCSCGPGESLCAGTCIPTSTDPSNCGGCNVVCPVGAPVCWGSKCQASCPTGFNLTACNGHCVNTAIDDNFCGGCPGTVCTGANHCSAGACGQTILGNTTGKACTSEPGPTLTYSFTIPADMGTTTTTDCSGNIAGTSFTWAICDCSNYTQGGAQTIDAYNSATGVGTGAKGGSLGINGNGTGTSTLGISGDLWMSGTDSFGSVTIGQQIHVQTTANVDNVGEQGFIHSPGGTLTFSGAGALGDLYTPTCPAPNASFTNGGQCVPQPVTITPPCLRCDAAEQVPIAKIVTFYATAAGASTDGNNNSTIGLSSTQLSGASPFSGKLDLPCGKYYVKSSNGTLPAINADNFTLAVHGNSALFVDGDFTVNKTFAIYLDPGTSIDIFVHGSVGGNNGAGFGQAVINQPSMASNLHFYIDGTAGWNAKASDAFAADVYVPNGPFTTGGSTTAYGSIFVGSLNGQSQVNIHYDQAVAGAPSTCPVATGGGCKSCLDCGNQACNGGTCGSCAQDSDCCAPLRCVNGTCEFTSF